uniref:C1q domain-containing protein n=1 Tax=Daphnia galeata TaxID=27404 RepID=A0A8J2WTR7_9CRUS|nr:unnamed protein product [Daphnia galeata]
MLMSTNGGFNKMIIPSPIWRLAQFAILVLVYTVNSQSDEMPLSSSWAKLQISPSELCSMPYGSFRVNIYEHANNHKTTTQPTRFKYFYAPIALLDHKSAVTSFNNVTKQNEVRFRIEMWNDKVESQVVNYLTEFVGQQIQSNQVQVIPLEKVVLSSTKPSSVFSLTSDWLPYQLHKSLQFTLSCLAQKDCDQLAADMRINPQQFDHFKLLFSLTSQTSQTKQTVIRIDNVVSGQMVSDLLQRFDQNVQEVFLTAKDEKRLLTETITNVFVDTFEDSDVISPNSELQVYNLLKNLLISSRAVIKEQSDKMWDSVFWNEDNYRPDKTTKTLNEMMKKLNKDSQKKMTESFQNNNKVSGGGKAKFLGLFSAKANFNKESSRLGFTSKEDLEKFYQESKDHVEWDGEKFVPKPLQLGRINLVQLRDTQSLKDHKMSVRYSTAVLSTPINFVQNVELTVTDEWQNIKEELKETIRNMENLKKELNDTNRNMENMKNELNEIERTSAIVDIGRMPTSCADLQRIGNKKNGFFSIMGQNKIQTVHCNFTKQQTDQNFQNTIGYVDVKSSPVYFHAQRSTTFTSVNSVVTFDKFRLNVGNSMKSYGIFFAPKSGKYFFSFSGISHQNSVGRVDLQMKTSRSDWFKIAQAYGEPNYKTLSLQSTVQLTNGDQIRLILSQGAIHENNVPLYGLLTHFVGWLIEEDFE